jgi:hypothetical protein
MAAISADVLLDALQHHLDLKGLAKDVDAYLRAPAASTHGDSKADEYAMPRALRDGLTAVGPRTGARARSAHSLPSRW